MKLPSLRRFLPSWKNAVLAIISALLLILAFPDFEFGFLAWFGLAPLFWVVEREKESAVRSFFLGWIWGAVFFTGTCWWLTYAPITYAGFPSPLAYTLLLFVTGFVGIFPGIFAAILAHLVKRFGSFAILAAPFVWVFTEFLRYWITGNNWNAVGYSQAAVGMRESLRSMGSFLLVDIAALGGVLMTSFLLAILNSTIAVSLVLRTLKSGLVCLAIVASMFAGIAIFEVASIRKNSLKERLEPSIIAVQPNVPMSGLTLEKWQALRRKHVELAESALATINEKRTTNNTVTVIFPESPMNFMYEEDDEFREFVRRFAAKHDVQVLFNSAEPDAANNMYFNSAVLVGPDGKEIAQYDKIYLVPFGESVPAPLQSIVPALVGSFSYGKEYDLLPMGGAKAGVMICFESHFGELGREYVRNGADAIIEMTNDGYLGPTPILRQHLANAIFRAVETNRPVLRVTNVGITAYIDGRGHVSVASEPYTEATRVWSVGKSDGSQTFYVKYGDWFAWLCTLMTVGLLGIAWWRRKESVPPAVAGG